ncbi:MAG: FKBP-type peptidyl-prolyl cis-trans isomerase [Woeseiaceae bacterium]
MKKTIGKTAFFVLAATTLLVGCKARDTIERDCEVVTEETVTVNPSVPENVTGLEATVLAAGRDQAVANGDIASMHYTGWLFDPDAEDGRGKKFDSSLDRNQAFEFGLGEGRVIRGWDIGVAGMQIGEKRRLKIAPELGYGAQGAGGVIPPNATLLFDVELVSFKRCTVFE